MQRIDVFSDMSVHNGLEQIHKADGIHIFLKMRFLIFFYKIFAIFKERVERIARID